jgi:methionine-S-sulfoxide reductase
MIPLFLGVETGEKVMEKATFAGGCFWCMEPPFKNLEGVEKVVSGYTGGEGKSPTYEDYEEKGHVEAVQVTYDPSRISYSDLLDVYWRQIDPTDPGGQFGDRGTGYRTAIFYHNEKQNEMAEKSRQELEESEKFDKPVFTEIKKAGPFYPAEEYHQNFYKKHPYPL